MKEIEKEEYEDIEEQVKELLKNDTTTLKIKPLPTITQLKKYIKEDKELLKKQLEIVESGQCCDCVLEYLLKQKMAEVMKRIEFYQFGIDMTAYGYELSENKISDKEAEALEMLVKKILED